MPVAYRSPSATAAIWQFQSGAVGSLTHSALLHRKKYDCELEVIGDGLRLELQDPYGACQLLVRMPGQDKSSIEPFGEDDSYLTEDTVFLEAVRRRDASAIRSPYADAFRTYELTWAVRSQTCSV